MLYVTTRNKVESVTAYHVLSHARSSDGGCFVPLLLPSLSSDEINAMTGKNFGQCMADVLNLFFSARLDGWDIDFCIGRHPVRLVPLNQKVYIAEAWHNPDRSFDRMIRNLSSRIYGDKFVTPTGDWARIATIIGVLFCSYGQMVRQGLLQSGQQMDISVDAGDFSIPMAAWYARKIGLPVGNIICASNDSSKFWDFLRNGSYQTASADILRPCIQAGLERLIYSVFGHEEVLRYLHCCSKGTPYSLNELRLNQLCGGFRASVVGNRRIASAIRSTFSTAAYLLDPATALAFCGLQDYRTAEGEVNVTLLLSENSPANFADTVCAAAGISRDELFERM